MIATFTPARSRGPAVLAVLLILGLASCALDRRGNQREITGARGPGAGRAADDGGGA
jgi:hypothetical protein